MEVYLLFSWIADSPVFGLSYVAVTILLGFVCINLAKVGFADVIQHVTQTRHGELHPGSMRALLVLGKMWAVGVLLIFPGYLTDILAVAIWLLVGGKQNPDDRKTPIKVSARFNDDGGE